MKLTCRFVFSILLFLSITTVFSQNFSDRETGFDAARITAALKKRGLTDENIQQEVLLMRKLHNEQYAAMKKSEDEILQKITSEQVLKTETNIITNNSQSTNKSLTVNNSLTAKTASTLAVDIPQTEKDALLALYNSTNGNSWTNKTGWDFSTPVTSGWYGITVTNGHVTAIILNNNNLVGTIPAAIGQLTEIQWLHLNANKLSGTIPVEIGQLTKLQELQLYTNLLSGTIPASIGQLTQLTTLGLFSNQLTGSIPATIGQLTKLLNLYLFNNQLSGTIPAEIGQLTQLQSLQLHTNQLTGTIPAEIGLLTNITTLYLYQNQLTGTIPTQIGQLTKITSLYLHLNQLTGIIPATIGKLTKTTTLLLYSNQLTGEIPAQIGQLTQLQYLSITNNQLSGLIPAEIGQLTKLQNLLLNNNQLSGTIPASIGQLTQLQNLFLHFNQLSGSIPAEIGQLANLTKLYISNNQLTGTIPTQIGQLTQLLELYLYNNQLSGTIPAQIGQLTKLISLQLYANQLTGTIPVEIGKLINVQNISLASNQLTGVLPTQIRQLAQLQFLSLNNNQLTGIIPSEIGQLTKLIRLYLQNNQFNGGIPVQIGLLTQLTELLLYSNQLSGSIPNEIGKLIKIQTINLGSNQLSGTIPATIGQLTSALGLLLQGNKLTGSIPAEIGQLTKLQYLYLYANQLSGTIPTSLGQLTQLQNLYLQNNQLQGNIPNLSNVTLGLSFHTNKFRFVDFASQFSAFKSKLTIFEYSNQAKTDSEVTITKTAGETQTLTMYEDGRFTPADTYQWYRNGVAVAGATSRQYTLSNLTTANAGDYHCVSTNSQMTISTVTNQNLVLTRNTIHLKVNNCNAFLSSAVGTNAQIICPSTAITPIIYTTAGLITGATFSGLPGGVTGTFASNTITISGTPASTGTFAYTVTYTGSCGVVVTSTGTIAVQTKTVNTASAAPVVCINNAIIPIMHATQGGTFTLGVPTGLPPGVTATWETNILTISGTPTTSGVFNYSIPLLGGCGSTINATGKITVSAPGTITLSSSAGTDNQSKNINTLLTPITYTTTGTTGAAVTGLPAGVTGSFASNTVTITGTPTVSGTFNYLITLPGECNTTISGKITSLCEPITGVIKIINEPTPTSYPFQFSNSNTTSSAACTQTTFPVELYTNTPTLGVGTILYWNDQLTTVYNGSNLWYQESAAGTSYLIGNSGQITQAVGCLKSFWYKADDVVVNPEPNYVIYLTEAGTQARFDLPREESGNPCEEIRAVKIIRFHRVSPCTPPGHAFRFSNSGTVQSAVCNQTQFPLTFYADSETLDVKTILYSDINLTTPITITGTNVWYKNEENGLSYKVNSLGKIGLISSCSTSGPGSGYAYQVSGPGRNSSGLACSQTTFPNTYYAATSSLGIGSQMYTSSSLTTKLGGGDVWYKCLDPDVFYAFKVGTGGIVTEIVTCGGN
ncbi:leucine-rich repeat domain-containing protein [Flavobacterium flavigenum]|uniref:leucine-rich repeat domain-containing protein n=1 Tax=Flavobacterium flavigenum TaxID=3003258 RepID=UPI002482B919|nr:leucine-rich repeat domain-containing protein [Flavobacterium flavigenum]